MTTGSETTGVFAINSHYHRARKWNGADGKYDLSLPGAPLKWNSYEVSSLRFASANPNKVKLLYVPTGEISEVENNQFEAFVYGPLTSTGHVSGNPFNEPVFNTYWGSNEELALLSDVVDKVKGHSFDMGVALAEVDKFAGTVLGTLKNLRYGIDDLRKLNFRRFARRFGARPPSRKGQRELSTRDISGRFLEMRYAWLPAIHDVYEASKAFEELSNGPRSVSFKARRRRSLPLDAITNYVIIPGLIEVGRTYRIQLLEELSWSASLGLNHPFSIAWERFPWSFVVDWFIPIGTYLSNLGVIPTMNARWLRTDYIRRSVVGSPVSTVFGNTHRLLPPHVNCNLEIFQMRRTPLSGPPSLPLPNLRVVGAIQGRRVQNAIALAHQVFSRG